MNAFNEFNKIAADAYRDKNKDRFYDPSGKEIIFDSRYIDDRFSLKGILNGKYGKLMFCSNRDYVGKQEKTKYFVMFAACKNVSGTYNYKKAWSHKVYTVYHCMEVSKEELQNIYIVSKRLQTRLNKYGKEYRVFDKIMK